MFAARVLRAQGGGTQVDQELDETTPNAGEYYFEKMVSGMYMGEVARRLILLVAVRFAFSLASSRNHFCM